MTLKVACRLDKEIILLVAVGVHDFFIPCIPARLRWGHPMG